MPVKNNDISFYPQEDIDLIWKVTNDNYTITEEDSVEYIRAVTREVQFLLYTEYDVNWGISYIFDIIQEQLSIIR
jgi:hypothetical protein